MGHDGIGMDTPGLGVVALPDEHGMRDRIVVQTRDMPQRERQAHRWLPVRSIERAVLRWGPGDIHAHIEGLLDCRHRALHLQIPSIAGAANYLKAEGPVAAIEKAFN